MEPSPERITTEIERRFLVISLPETLDLLEYPAKKIEQGYFMNTQEGSVRIRRKGEQFFWTVKKPSTGHAAEKPEFEVEITPVQFEKMWPGTAGKRLKKTRHEIPFDDNTIELDLFEGENAGHMLAEVEFKSTTAADLFTPPDWFGPEVTADKRFSNGNIAEFGFPKV